MQQRHEPTFEPTSETRQAGFLSLFGPGPHLLTARGADLPNWYYKFVRSAVEQIPHAVKDEMNILTAMRPDVRFCPGDNDEAAMRAVWTVGGIAFGLTPSIVISAPDSGDPINIYILDRSVPLFLWERMQEALARLSITTPSTEPSLPLPCVSGVSILNRNFDDQSQDIRRYDPDSLGEFMGVSRTPPNYEQLEADYRREYVSSYKESNDDTAESCDPGAPQFLPEGFQVGLEDWDAQGVFVTVDGVTSAITSSSIWLTGIDQLPSGETLLQLCFLSHSNRRVHITMPAAYLADKRLLSSHLLSRNFAGFALTPKALHMLVEYLRGSVITFNKNRPTQTAYDRFGWNSKGFLLGTENITPEGIESVNVFGIPSEIKAGFVPKGDADTWAKVTYGLDHEKYWAHCFVILSMFGSCLLHLMGDVSAVLSVSGPSGGGKTTAASLGASSFCNPQVSEISPQSTEKAFYEVWRLFQNLPMVTNEATTINPHILQNVTYGAANGVDRKTLTAKVQLRDSNRWSMLNVFTSNNHLHGVDDSTLNEAGRRRALTVTIDNPLERDLAREIHEVIKPNHGRAGRIFMQYVVRNRSKIAEHLEADRTWAHENGIASEDRFAAFIIASAKRAGAIAQALGLLRFDVLTPCLRAIESTKTQAKEIKTATQLVEELFADFINSQRDHFTESRNDARGLAWTKPDTHGGVVGRLTQEKGKVIVAISKKAFNNYARENGSDPMQVAKFCKEKGIDEKAVRLVASGKPTRCFTYIEADTDSQLYGAPLHLVENTLPESQAAH